MKKSERQQGGRGELSSGEDEDAEVGEGLLHPHQLPHCHRHLDIWNICMFPICQISKLKYFSKFEICRQRHKTTWLACFCVC